MDKTYIKHIAAVFLSAMIICFNIPYNFGVYGLDKATWASILVISLVCLGLIELVFFYQGIDSIFVISKRKAVWILNFIIIVFILTLFFLHIIHYKNLGFKGRELGHFYNALWNTLNGGGFLYDSIHDVFCLTVHPAPLIFLILLPFYMLCQHIYTLFFIQDIFFCYASLPLFFLLSRKFNYVTSMVISIGFLFYPYILSHTFISIRDTVFIPFFLFFVFYFFETKNFYFFILFLFLSLLARETVVLPCFIFVFYAVLKRRSARWTIGTVLINISCLFAFILIHNSLDYYLFKHFPHAFPEPLVGILGSNSVIGTMLKKLFNFNLLKSIFFNFDFFKYLYKLFSPMMLILPLLSVEILFIIPELLVILLILEPAALYPVWHYSTTISIFVWIATASTIYKIINIKKLKELLDITGERLSLAIAIVILLLTVSAYHTWYCFIKPEKMHSSYYQALKDAARCIPQEASVGASTHLLPFFCQRKHIVPLDRAELTDYIIIGAQKKDFEEVEKFFKPNLAPYYNILFSNEGIEVYKKQARD